MQQQRRYKAFISYCHADEQWARWLQRALEGYRLPRPLRAAHPEMPARLFPIFRDRDELASSTSLSESIRQAMDDSDALVVICSPAAAKSQWVNEEVRRFRAARGDGHILCLMVAGRPNADAPDCAFPPALLRGDDGETHEPLAADIAGDGRRNAMLKIAAGLLGVGVDELKRRHAQRQARFWASVAGGAMAIAMLTIGLAIVAFIARQESEIRRKQGEKLIGFMLGDLRNKLEPIGKLDVLDSVGDQAMDYFASLGNRGTPQEMLDRAKALRQIGDVRFHQGHLEPALKAFQQSLQQALALHEAAPDNNNDLFELGQAEFWVGYVAWQRNELQQAHASMQKYMQYTKELVDRAPQNADYRTELAYAHNNLGSVAKAQGHPEEALAEFRTAVAIREAQLQSKAEDSTAIADLAKFWSWIGSTLQDLGRLHESERAAEKAAGLMLRVQEKGQDVRASAKYADYLLLLADAQLKLGQSSAASQQVESARAIYKKLLAHDPSNADWRQSALNAEYYRVTIEPPATWTQDIRASLAACESGLQEIADKDPSNMTVLRMIGATKRLQALGALEQGDISTALRLSKEAHDVMHHLTGRSSVPVDAKIVAAQVNETLGAAMQAQGDRSGATAIWKQTLTELGLIPDDNLAAKAIRRLLALDLGDAAGAARMAEELQEADFRDPRYAPYAKWQS